MKIVCTIEARMTSTRLPGKVLLPVMGRPMLDRMIERLRRARTLDEIVIATTVEPSDDPIEELGRALGVGTFRGSEQDVLARVLGAARAYDADVIVETTGDCPLHEPAIIDKVVADYLIGGADFVSNILPHTTPRGTDVRVFSTNALANVAGLTNDPADREHVSLYFIERATEYRLRNVETALPPSATELRLTVDTPEDFELITRVFEELYPGNPEFTISDVVDLLDRRPDLASINGHIRQKQVR